MVPIVKTFDGCITNMRKLNSLDGLRKQRKEKLLKKWGRATPASIFAQITDLHKRADALHRTMPFLPSVRERENAVIQAGELRSRAYRLALQNHGK